ncbi:unnamed protein product [Gordionus sp. m RMFG-2023]
MPAIIKNYNEGMGGGDLHDMLVELYRTDIKWKRYYMRMVFHLLYSCVVNAWLLYRRHMKALNNIKFMPLLVFKSQIAKGLMFAGKDNTKKTSRPSSIDVKRRKAINNALISDIRYDQVGHFPMPVSIKQRCKYCVEAYSRIICKKFNIYLCLIINEIVISYEIKYFLNELAFCPLITIGIIEYLLIEILEISFFDENVLFVSIINNS